MKVIHNNLKVILEGMLFACTDGINIYIDDDFYKLSNNIKKFILAHEEGHVVLKHFTERSTYLDVEKEADRYAFEHVGIEPTEEFISLIESLCCDEDDEKEVKAVKARISSLKTEIAIQKIIDSKDEARMAILADIFEEAANIFGGLAEDIRGEQKC